jgi:hypothetical protein
MLVNPESVSIIITGRKDVLEKERSSSDFNHLGRVGDFVRFCLPPSKTYRWSRCGILNMHDILLSIDYPHRREGLIRLDIAENHHG